MRVKTHRPETSPNHLYEGMATAQDNLLYEPILPHSFAPVLPASLSLVGTF
jgi:hypothetical protein